MKENTPILLVIDHFGSGGAQRQIVNIANGLVEVGEDVHIFIYYPEFTHHRAYLDNRVIVHETVKSNKFGFSVVFKLIGLLYKYNYKSALVFLNTPAFYLELASLFYVKKIILTYSERTSLELMPIGLLSKIRYKFHGVCKNITSNSIVQSEKLKLVHVNKNVVYIPNAMPKPFFDIKINPKAIEERIFAVVAHTTPFKNFRYVAEALVLYKTSFSSPVPKIYWYGRIIKSNEFDLVERLLQEHDLTDNLVFYGAAENIPLILENSFMLIHPSKFESSSNSVAEALATGTPTILGNISDHEIILNDSSAGFLVDLEKPIELSRCLEAATKIDAIEYQQLCENAKYYATENFKSESVLKKYIRLLND